MKNKKKYYAFTLIEILIALFIFSILAVIVLVGLHSSLNTYQHVKDKGNRFAALQVALTVLQRDVNQAVPRAIINPDDQISPAVKGVISRFDLTRGGYVNPQSIEKRSTLQRVAYQYKNNQLIRFTWPMLDSVSSAQPASRVLLTGVDQLTFYYIDSHNAARHFWPIISSQLTNLPRAIELTMHVQGLGNISRLFIVPGGVALAKK